ncbi:two component system sensor histidine kinase [Candidatus Magnetomorum sp. HK-1]|nr:two component system sensor histidine kinase [Candidatus Magnetomorum sp. HK-1]
MKSIEKDVHVLIIDDEQSIREGCARILSRIGCDISTASRGEDGLEILKNTNDISIVLLDLKMPGIDGMEVLSRIRKSHKDIMVIIMTGFATVETAIQAMKQGAYDFIPKPFEPDHVRLVVNRAREKIKLTWQTEKLTQERQRTLLDLGTEKSRLTSIIEALPNGVMVTNSQGQVVLLNPALKRQLSLPDTLKSGMPIEALIDDVGFQEFVHKVNEISQENPDEISTYELKLPDQKFFMARGRPVLGDENECLGVVIILVNITVMKVLDQLKSEFVAKVSHELRSPLSTIHEQLAVVLNELGQENASDKQEYLLSRAKEKTQGLISLIGDLLDLSRIEAGAATQDPRPIQIEDLLASIVDFLGARTKRKKQKLSLEKLSEKIPPFTADPLSLESIFGNLITNAINYTPEDGTITVRIEHVDNNICVAIQDTGFGIDPKYHDKIFDRFYRVKDANTRYITGTGLGLPIVKGLVDTLGGKLILESVVGEGTTFHVVLPVDKNP